MSDDTPSKADESADEPVIEPTLSASDDPDREPVSESLSDVTSDPVQSRQPVSHPGDRPAVGRAAWSPAAPETAEFRAAVAEPAVVEPVIVEPVVAEPVVVEPGARRGRAGAWCRPPWPPHPRSRRSRGLRAARPAAEEARQPAHRHASLDRRRRAVRRLSTASSRPSSSTCANDDLFGPDFVSFLEQRLLLGAGDGLPRRVDPAGAGAEPGRMVGPRLRQPDPRDRRLLRDDRRAAAHRQRLPRLADRRHRSPRSPSTPGSSRPPSSPARSRSGPGSGSPRAVAGVKVRNVEARATFDREQEAKKADYAATGPVAGY